MMDEKKRIEELIRRVERLEMVLESAAKTQASIINILDKVIDRVLKGGDA
jgi:hypothetical protein